MCAVDLARVKAAVMQFLLHRAHVVLSPAGARVIVCKNGSGDRKPDRDCDHKNKPLPHTTVSNAARCALLRRLNRGAVAGGDLVKPVLPATPKRANAGAESKGRLAETNQEPRKTCVNLRNLWTIAELTCGSDPTTHLAFVLQIRLAEFRGEIPLFAKDDTVMKNQRERDDKEQSYPVVKKKAECDLQ